LKSRLNGFSLNKSSLLVNKPNIDLMKGQTYNASHKYSHIIDPAKLPPVYIFGD